MSTSRCARSVTTHAKDLFHESVDEVLPEQLLTRAGIVLR